METTMTTPDDEDICPLTAEEIEATSGAETPMVTFMQFGDVTLGITATSTSHGLAWKGPVD
jgi:hypothetical protein